MTRLAIQTQDGSYSLVDDRTQETYHSMHGAHNESMHVFIQNGLVSVADRENTLPIRVLEIGFGTGYNALLSLQYAREKELAIDFVTIEKYPLNAEEWQSIQVDNMDDMAALHRAEWNTICTISEGFNLQKIQADFQDMLMIDIEPVDVIYYDAFSPTTQPELWTVETLKPIVAKLKKGGVLVTYCAQGQFRRNLESLGMQTERLPGPPGKREMIRATLC